MTLDEFVPPIKARFQVLLLVLPPLIAAPVPSANAQPCSGHWEPMGTGMNDAVQAVVTMPNGDIVAGGNFGIAGGVTTWHVARWDGSAWGTLGPPVDGTVWDLAVLPNGDLVAAGNFAHAGGV